MVCVTPKKTTEQPDNNSVTPNATQQRKELIRRWLLTFTVWYANFSAGGAVTIFGPALIDLQYVYGTTIHVSVIFTAMGAGLFVGALVGGILIDKLSWRFHFVISTLGISLTFMTLPWIPVFWLFMCTCFLLFVFDGFIETAASVVMHRLWSRSHHHNSVLHAVRLSWSLGATLSPFILEPFLAKNSLPEDYSVNSNRTLGNATYMNSVNASTSNQTTTQIKTNVQLGIFAFGCVVAVSAVLSCVVFVFDKCPIHFKKDTDATDQSREQSFEQCQTKKYRGVFMFLLFTVVFFLVSVEFSTGSLLSTFVFRALKWEASTGSFLTSIFWGAFGISRLCGVFITRIISTTKLLYILLVAENITIIILVLSVQTHDVIAWIFFPVLGFSAGACLPSLVCVAAQYIGVNGRVGLTIMCSVSVATIIMPFVTGYLIDTVGPMALFYVICSAGPTVLFTFVALDCFARRCNSRTGN